MNTDLFTGKAEVYHQARPGYPAAAVDYILNLTSSKGNFADIGAGTGKFTELLAAQNRKVYAVEPNGDMIQQLKQNLILYQNAVLIEGTAEHTNLDDNSMDIIICAQSLHWFDVEAFWKECRRIGKKDALVMAIYNRYDRANAKSSNHHRDQAVSHFFTHPTVHEFENPIHYDRERWLAFMLSHSYSPLPNSPEYSEYMEQMNEIFDRENIDGVLIRQAITTVFSQRVHEPQ